MFKPGLLNLWATEEFLRGHGLVSLKMNTLSKMNLNLKTWVPSKIAGPAFALIVAHVVLLNDFLCIFLPYRWATVVVLEKFVQSVGHRLYLLIGPHA